jgi:selenocysteine lyase/cysteine desulfurase
MPKKVYDRISEYNEYEYNHGGYEAYSDNLSEIYEFYVSTAKLLSCKKENIAFMANATDAYNKALSSIPFGRNDTILTTTNDYASNQIAFLSLKKRYGVNVQRIPNIDNGLVDVEKMERLIQIHEPKLVAVTHVPNNSGLIQSVEEIGLLCNKYSILYLVDACQSVGQMPVDVNKIKCDFLSATMRKYLRGPRGAGFLYVSDKALNEEMHPLLPDLRGANWVTDNEFEIVKTAKRFEDWENNYGSMIGAKEAINYALSIGLDNIYSRVSELAIFLRESLEKKGWKVLDHGPKLSGIVSCDASQQDADKICLDLRKKGFQFGVANQDFALIDFQEKKVQKAFRITPHYYNTKEEIKRFVAELSNVAK